jgi:preprotein translocase subunit YajC
MAAKTWAKGDRVVQPTYGAGTIVEYNEHHVVIEFDENGRRTFSTRLVVLQTTTEPAPAKAARKRAPRKTKAKKTEPAEEE